MKKGKKLGLALNKKVIKNFNSRYVSGGIDTVANCGDTQWKYAGTYFCCGIPKK